MPRHEASSVSPASDVPLGSLAQANITGVKFGCRRDKRCSNQPAAELLKRYYTFIHNQTSLCGSPLQYSILLGILLPKNYPLKNNGHCGLISQGELF